MRLVVAHSQVFVGVFLQYSLDCMNGVHVSSSIGVAHVSALRKLAFHDLQ